MASEKIVAAFKQKIDSETAKLPPRPEIKNPETSDEEHPSPVYEAVRNLMIRKIDRLWQEHLLAWTTCAPTSI